MAAYASVTASVGAMARPQEIQILAEMVANVMTVGLAPGDTVAVGDTVVLLDSLKMEIPVISEHACTVAGVFVTAVDVVQEVDVLLSIKA